MTQQSDPETVADQLDDVLVGAERRVPDVADYAGGVSSASHHTALRASVRQLGRLLGEAITRHEGPKLLEQVERIRQLSREHRDEELHAELAGVDGPTAVRLARAFTAYFQLVNITEQLHRWREVTADGGSPLRAAAGRIGKAMQQGTVDSDLIIEVLSRLEYRPVFTAHPTEASRRSVLELLRKIAGVVAALEDSPRAPADRPRLEHRLAELVDLLWQTDELRVVRPEPKDEARTATYYLQSLARQVIPDLLEDLDSALASIGIELPSHARPLRFGSWAGGDRDGNPNVTPHVTLEVLAQQHDFGLRTLIANVEELLTESTSSTRIVRISDALAESLSRDAEALPITHATLSRLNAEEPYRLKLSYVRVRLRRTRDRLAEGTAHEPGRDYLGLDELLHDLRLVRDSMLADGDLLTANGGILRLIRTATAVGLGLATLDIREHSGKHHTALSGLYDRVGELTKPYAELDRAERIALLATEMEHRIVPIGPCVVPVGPPLAANRPPREQLPTSCCGRWVMASPW